MSVKKGAPALAPTAPNAPAGTWRLSPNTACAALLLSLGGAALAQSNTSPCGAIEKSDNGPYDYRTERNEHLNVVEKFHFTPNIETLVSGNSGPIGGEIDFTLRAYPNHHRALIAMMGLGEKTKSTQPYGARFSVECYFDRALRFRPDDGVARMIYATFLSKNNRDSEVAKQLAVVAESAGDNPFTHYNIGLIYFDAKIYDQALIQAHKAYGLGFVQPTLRDRLKSVGKWKEPDEPTRPPVAEDPKAPTAPEKSSSDAAPAASGADPKK